MEEVIGLGRKITFTSEEGSVDQGSGASDSHIHNELFQAANGPLWWNWKAHSKVLVGTNGWLKEDSLG